MNREEAPGKSPEEMYIQQKVRVLLMLKKMGSNLTPNEEAFLRNYAGVVHSQMSQLPQHPIDQGEKTSLNAVNNSRLLKNGAHILFSLNMHMSLVVRQGSQCCALFGRIFINNAVAEERWM
uniref:Beta-catenin-interacting protein 1 n=2 Tax=Cyprinus carpio TaxID=7962 RepID=A0A9J7XNY7_CYPCA